MNKQEHLLATLAEECAEVQHAIGKALRFGPDDSHPDRIPTNAQDIEKELMEVLAIRDMLRDLNVLKEPADAQFIYVQKRARAESYMEYARELKTLDIEDA